MVYKATPARPVLLKYRSSEWFIVTTVSLAVFTDIFLYGLIVPIMPFALSNRVGVPPDQVQYWVSILLSVYGIALLVGSPIVGWFADRNESRRLPFLIGLLAAAASMLMQCFGTSMAILIFGRLLLGLSAAVVWTVGLALLIDTVGQTGIGQVMGVVSLAATAGIISGPALGGIGYSAGGYYAVFAVVFGLIAFDIILRFVMIEKKIAAQWTVRCSDNEDAYGTMNKGDTSRCARILSNSEQSARKLLSRPSSEVAASGSSPLLRRESAVSSEDRIGAQPKAIETTPAVFTLLKSWRLVVALWGCMIQSVLTTSFDGVLPLFVKRLFGWNSAEVGLIFLALVIPTFASPWTGSLSDKYGARWVAASGFIVSSPLIALLSLITHDTIQDKISLGVLLFLVGFGLTLVLPALMAEMTHIVASREIEHPGIFGPSGAFAQAYGLFTCVSGGGLFIGPAMASYVEIRAGWGQMCWTLGLLSALSAIPVILFTGKATAEPH